MSEPLATALTNTDPNSCVTACTQRLGKPRQASNQCLPFLGEWESGRMNGVTRIFYSSHIRCTSLKHFYAWFLVSRCL
jgi:lysozyme